MPRSKHSSTRLGGARATKEVRARSACSVPRQPSPLVPENSARAVEHLNVRIGRREHPRFPLSNWTELTSLYNTSRGSGGPLYSRNAPVLERDGM